MFRSTLTSELKPIVVDEIVDSLARDPAIHKQIPAVRALFLKWMHGDTIPGEHTVTSLAFGRVVIESFVDRAQVYTYSPDGQAFSYSKHLSISMPLDEARQTWGNQQKRDYCAAAFSDSAHVLNAEYPGGADQAQWELELWFG